MKPTRFALLTILLAGVTAAAAAGMACSSTNADKPATATAPDSATTAPPVTDDASEPADASDAAAPDASSCLADDSEPLPDCDAISDGGGAGDGGDGGDAGDSCIFTDFGRFACYGYHDHLKRGLARKAIDCVIALPASCGIGGGPPVQCAHDFAPQVCTDPTTAGFCQPLVEYCADAGAQYQSMLSQQDCESYASLLNAAGRADFASCITGDPQQACAPSNLADCLGRIK